MRNLLALIGLVVVGFVGAGWYLGWYKVGVESNNPNQPKFGVELEADKIKKDLRRGANTVGSVFSDKEVKGQLTSQPINPGDIPLPPPPPPVVLPGGGVDPVSIPLPPPPSFR